MLTVGTSGTQLGNQPEFQLLPSHSYAVIGEHDSQKRKTETNVSKDVQDTGSERYITILDPWVRPADSGALSEEPSRTYVISYP